MCGSLEGCAPVKASPSNGLALPAPRLQCSESSTCLRDVGQLQVANQGHHFKLSAVTLDFPNGLLKPTLKCSCRPLLGSVSKAAKHSKAKH